MFDGKLYGYVAIGDMIYFRPLYGPDAEVMRTPPDVDSHRLAATMNEMQNALIAQVRSQSEYNF